MNCSGSWTSFAAIASVFLFIGGFAAGLGNNSALEIQMVSEIFSLSLDLSRPSFFIMTSYHHEKNFVPAGSIPWLMVNELFTTEFRGLANTICCSVNLMSSIILLLTYTIVKVGSR